MPSVNRSRALSCRAHGSTKTLTLANHATRQSLETTRTKSEILRKAQELTKFLGVDKKSKMVCYPSYRSQHNITTTTIFITRGYSFLVLEYLFLCWASTNLEYTRAQRSESVTTPTPRTRPRTKRLQSPHSCILAGPDPNGFDTVVIRQRVVARTQ